MRNLTRPTDPVFKPNQTHGAVNRFFLRYIEDERDLPFIYLSILLTFLLIPAAVFLFLPILTGWMWYLVATVYLFMMIYMMGPYVLMLHNTSHRMLFKREYRGMNLYIPWVLGPFFGQSPETYFGHHIGMHHPENNLEGDESSTMTYQRDSLPGFLHYLFTFLTIGLWELVNYFRRKKRKKLMQMVIRGEFSFLFLCIALCFVNWHATLFVFILPLLIVRFGMMAGNWGQHAFIDAAAPENCYRNSITCINTDYNHRCFNDGYHIGHHLDARMHWTDMATDFWENQQHYVEERAIVFEGIDFFGVWLLLMLKRYDKLASHFVNIGGLYHSDEEVIAMIKVRLKPIVRPEFSALHH